MYAIVVIVLLCGWPHSTQCSEPMTAEDIQNLEDVIPGEYIILLSTESNAPINEQMSKMKEFADGHGLRSVTFSGHAEIGSVKAVRASGSHFEMEVLRQHENVKKISRNNIVRALHQPLAMTKEDTEICTQQQTGETLWGLTRISQKETPITDDGKYFHETGSGLGVTAYVVDTGIYLEHDEFEGRATHGFTASELRNEGDDDLNGHGSHVAGTIGGRTYGVSKKTSLVAVKVLGRDGSGSLFGILEGAEWIINHYQGTNGEEGPAKGVINMSLGGSANDLLDNIVRVLVSYGLNVVVAAGNDAGNACNLSPARAACAITTGATEINDELAYFSSHGPCVDILAPGVGIESVGIGDVFDTAVYDGTSMAAPHVAGVVARYLSGVDEPPSPAQVSGCIRGMAVENKINLLGLTDTDNLLLHSPCFPAEYGLCSTAAEIPCVAPEDTGM